MVFGRPAADQLNTSLGSCKTSLNLLRLSGFLFFSSRDICHAHVVNEVLTSEAHEEAEQDGIEEAKADGQDILVHHSRHGKNN